MGFGSTTWGGPASAGSSTGGTPASDLIYHALRLAGVTLLSDRVPSAEQYDDGLRALNRMLSSWNTVRKFIATVRIDLWNTAPNTQAYTIGPGGDWDGPRPNKIVWANFLFPTNPTVRRKIEVLTVTGWASIVLQQIYTYPRRLFYQRESDTNSALGEIRFEPIPDNAYQIELFTPQPLAAPVTITDTLNYPDGYEQAIVYNLAKMCMGVFRATRMKDPEGDQLVMDEARASLARIKPAEGSPAIETDPISHRGYQRGFNWLDGI